MHNCGIRAFCRSDLTLTELAYSQLNGKARSTFFKRISEFGLLLIKQIRRPGLFLYNWNSKTGLFFFKRNSGISLFLIKRIGGIDSIFLTLINQQPGNAHFLWVTNLSI
ncbi:hypothetical protein PGT21_016670 [Puccinia graminis f. sp. tritici]|uniref:Uncharacterized protein n=1 Tax=Puccinia graminis f. sp. tritici TaxID=56615 RepID=A0A5B0NMM9_PUCGR|nr:hypothetical protein PGT21_016670 [Puccinia graminis f. sp. tritici]